jgi:transaldolase
MKIFLDTTNIAEISELSQLGIVDGITTNPSLIARTNGDFTQIIKEIATIVDGPISAEVISLKYDDMIIEALKLVEIADNIVIKLPLTFDGLRACRYLSDKNIKVNVTLCFSASQALIAAKCGATYISLFIGRLDDISADSISLIEDTVMIYDNYQIKTQILAASVRSPSHVILAAKSGADVVTVSPHIIKQMINHPLTDQGIDKFLNDWKKSGKTI